MAVGILLPYRNIKQFNILWPYQSLTWQYQSLMWLYVESDLTMLMSGMGISDNWIWLYVSILWTYVRLLWPYQWLISIYQDQTWSYIYKPDVSISEYGMVHKIALRGYTWIWCGHTLSSNMVTPGYNITMSCSYMSMTGSHMILYGYVYQAIWYEHLYQALIRLVFKGFITNQYDDYALF